MATSDSFEIRLATEDDMPAMMALMDRSIRALLEPYLPPEGVEASFEFMGIDTQLIRDGTYYAVTTIDDGEEVIVGCGGWSRRETLFGGDHTRGRDPRLLDPAREPARVRAMYTHPDYVRCGIGTLVIDHCERVAIGEGFVRFSLASTLAGEPLYRKCGYVPVQHFDAVSSKGIKVPLIRMEKSAPDLR